ncbi:MAG: GNAT family N-acetyltransferase [Crocinitomicaceae bacterium]|nr:GNAT family N-acetyltransferase [Crocinitomicaceae bacterium]
MLKEFKIVTERLLIRKFTISDAAFMLELMNTPQWIKNIGDRNVKTIQDAENYLQKGALRYDELKGISFYAVCLRESEKVIGTCGFVKREFLEDVDFGFAFLPAYFGKGYAFESAVAMLDFGFDTLELHQCAAICLHENDSSVKLLKRLGFSYEKDITLQPDNELLALYKLNLAHRV